MLKQFEEHEVLGRETRGALKKPDVSALNPL
jgi:hypothetical protein